MKQKIVSDIEKIISLSRHAPSSHNTQPWKIYVNDTDVVLGYDASRQLLVGDPEKRELFISLGCFAETFTLAAQEIGYKVDVAFVGDQPDKVARISLTAQKAEESGLSTYITTRRSDRRLYSTQKLPDSFTQQVITLSESTASIKLLTDHKDISYIADRTYDATLEAMLNPAFRTELSTWVRNNWTRQADGMPAYVQGIPGPVSLLAKTIIKNAKMVPKDQSKKDSQRVLHSAAIALICVKQITPESLFSAGRLYQRLCLMASANDVKTAGISAAVISKTTNQMLKNELDITETPVALVRLGYAKKTMKASPRLSVGQIIDHTS